MTDMPIAGRASLADECLGSVTEAAQLVADVGRGLCGHIWPGIVDPA